MEAPANLDAAYRQYRRLLFGVLMTLAERGLSPAIDDGLDVVHDFFIEEYAGLQQRFDPERGRFTTLLHQAFSRFALRRLVRQQRLRAALVSPEVLEKLGGATGESAVGRDGDRQRVATALAQVAIDDRALLAERFVDDHSEREIARARGWTRYHTRERVVRALGLLAAALGESAGGADRDWEVARAVWSDERSIDDVAAAFDLTREQVRRAVGRTLQVLTAVIQRGDQR